MKNNIQQILGTPTIDYSFVSPGGRVERETRTYNINAEKKIVVETYRRQGKKNVKVTAYVHNPKLVVIFDGTNEFEVMREWEPVIRLCENSHDNIDRMIAQAYGVVWCMTK